MSICKHDFLTIVTNRHLWLRSLYPYPFYREITHASLTCKSKDPEWFLEQMFFLTLREDNHSHLPLSSIKRVNHRHAALQISYHCKGGLIKINVFFNGAKSKWQLFFTHIYGTTFALQTIYLISSKDILCCHISNSFLSDFASVHIKSKLLIEISVAVFYGGKKPGHSCIAIWQPVASSHCSDRAPSCPTTFH